MDGNSLFQDAMPEIFSAMKICVVVIWVMTPCIGVIGYQRPAWSCCHHLNRCHNPEDHDMNISIRECIHKFLDWPPGARIANGTALCHQMQSYRYFVSQSSEFCLHNPLCCFLMSVCFCLFRYRLSLESFGYTLVCYSSICQQTLMKTLKNACCGAEIRSRDLPNTELSTTPRLSDM
jgi:hypothetical protein